MLSYYQILQVAETASNDEIKKSYRKLCKILHPDIHGNTPEANTIFRLLHEAYDTLSDTSKRNNYNPKDFSKSPDSFTAGAYSEIISRYKKMMGDYEDIIKQKNKREKDLLNQINQLKKSTEKAEYETQQSSTFVQNKQTQNVQNPHQNKIANNTGEVILWIIISIIGLTMIILYVVYPVFMTFIMILIFLIGWIYKIFK